MLTGNAGADVFRFTLGEAGTDRVTDFLSGTDKLDGRAIGLTSFAAVSWTDATAGVVIAAGSETVTLSKVHALQSGDFVF